MIDFIILAINAMVVGVVFMIIGSEGEYRSEYKSRNYSKFGALCSMGTVIAIVASFLLIGAILLLVDA